MKLYILFLSLNLAAMETKHSHATLDLKDSKEHVTIEVDVCEETTQYGSMPTVLPKETEEQQACTEGCSKLRVALITSAFAVGTAGVTTATVLLVKYL